MIPTIHQEGDALTFEWDIGVARVSAEVDEVHHETGGWHAEVTWLNLSDNEHPLIMSPKNINLSSPQSCKTLAKTLEENTGLDAEWPQMIEQICYRAVSNAKAGKPSIKIGGVGAIPLRLYRVEKLLEEKQLTWFYGFGESGKSLLADALALSVQSMGVILGLNAEYGEVYYLDWETDEDEHAHRLRRIANGAGLYECPEIHYRNMEAPLVQDARNLKRYIAANNIKLVVIDSVEMAMGSNRHEASPLLPMVAAIRSWGVTTCCIDHISKAEGRESGDKKTPYGDIRKWNVARSAFEVRGVSETGKDHKDIAIYHRKANNGKHLSPMGYRVTFTDDQITFKRSEMMDVPELAQGTPYADQIEAVLKRHSMAPASIRELTGIAEDTIRTTLNRGAKTGRFQKNADGSWALPYKGE